MITKTSLQHPTIQRKIAWAMAGAIMQVKSEERLVGSAYVFNRFQKPIISIRYTRQNGFRFFGTHNKELTSTIRAGLFSATIPKQLVELARSSSENIYVN